MGYVIPYESMEKSRYDDDDEEQEEASKPANKNKVINQVEPLNLPVRNVNDLNLLLWFAVYN